MGAEEGRKERKKESVYLRAILEEKKVFQQKNIFYQSL